MKIFLLSGEILKKTALYIICFLLISSFTWAQETSSELELEEKEYQIIGRDTRVFSITGERKSTVEFIPEPLILQEEDRTIESSEWLISESERIRREESFLQENGFFSYIDYSYGAHKTNDLFGKVSFNTGNYASALILSNRSAEENNLRNTAPMSQGIELANYYNTSLGSISAKLGLSREDDDAVDSNFRPGSRNVERYYASIKMKSAGSSNWILDGSFLLKGGTFRNFGILNELDELVLDGEISAHGNISAINVTASSSAKYIELGGQNGSFFTGGVSLVQPFMNFLSIRAGVDFYAFDRPDIPDKGTITRFYPTLNIDLAITPHSFLRFNYKPGITAHSFSDIYDNNGLVSTNTPMLFEDREVDFEGELGIRAGSGFSASLGGFYIKTVRPLLFSRSGDYFDVIGNTDINLSGYRLKSAYEKNNLLGLEGVLTINRPEWDFGEAPYIPNIEACFESYYSIFSSLELSASVHFYGEHYVEINSADKEDSFFTIDTGIEKEIWKRHLSAYIDFRNLTNSKGSWWTNKYKIPGRGLYLGVKTQF